MKQNKFLFACIVASVLILVIAAVSILKFQQGSNGMAAAGAGLIMFVIIGWVDRFKIYAHEKRVGKIWPKR
ncbi:MAG: hypothetical protein EOP09_09860 [Proteobacteria bacterium]|nr:MAG: hypothetical protein EOP09_09860 [Pseudomonadota bacterium]